jgi:hypothetical protein
VVRRAIELLANVGDRADAQVEGRLATLAIRLGDAVEAARLDAALAAYYETYLHGRHLVWRAHLAAMRGDAEAAVDLLRGGWRTYGSCLPL